MSFGSFLPSPGASGALLVSPTSKGSKNYAKCILNWDQEGDTGIYSLSVVSTFLVGYSRGEGVCVYFVFAPIVLGKN